MVGPIVSVAGAVAIEFRLNGPFLPLIPCKLSKHDVKKTKKQNKIQRKTKKMSSLWYGDLLMILALT